MAKIVRVAKAEWPCYKGQILLSILREIVTDCDRLGLSEDTIIEYNHFNVSEHFSLEDYEIL